MTAALRMSKQPAEREPLMSAAEAARLLGLDKVSRDPENAVLRMCRRGTLRGVRVGKWTMIDLASLDAVLRGTLR